jgi:hypothetical protein
VLDLQARVPNYGQLLALAGEGTMNAIELASALVTFRFRYNNEKELQAGVFSALTTLEVPFIPEHPLNPQDRVDFYIPVEMVGIEVKTNDSRGGAGLSAVTRQLWRYAKCDDIKSLILITTRSKHRDLPTEILGKPLLVVYLNSFL